jgi:hypothetical protein
MPERSFAGPPMDTLQSEEAQSRAEIQPSARLAPLENGAGEVGEVEELG